MALKDQPEMMTTPAFETEGETMTTTATPDVAQTTEQAAATAKAVVNRAATSAVAAPARKLTLAFSGMKDVFDAQTVSALSRATPRVTAEQGSLYKDRKDKLGDQVRIEVLSWNKRWAVSPGSDNAEAKELFRVSYDNEFIDGEDVRVEDYLASLKDMGYDKAKVHEYGDLFGYLVWTSSKGDIPVDEREMVLVQMAPTSLGAFTAFCVSRGILESKGLVQAAELIEIEAQAKESKGNKYTNMAFKAVK